MKTIEETFSDIMEQKITTYHKSPIGQRIKILRELSGLSQQELAVKCGGMSKESVFAWENGRRAPEDGSIIRIAKALKVKVCDLKP